MAASDRDIQKTIALALSGKNAHVASKDVVAGLSWRLAGRRPDGAPHSVFQIVNHMTYWQEWVIRWFDGEKPRAPRHAASGWPGTTVPASAREWQQAVRRFRRGLADLARRSSAGDVLVKRGKSSGLEMLQAIASHTSYHAGQIATLRQVLGSWPPPSGGLTW